jgi:protein phosphatase PTC7
MKFMNYSESFAMIPHILKRNFGGEDGFLIENHGGKLFAAVADGVGGWKSKYGYSAAKFTHQFLDQMRDLILSGVSDPDTLVAESLENVLVPGACTLILIIIQRDTGDSIIYQIGDCNFLQLNNENSVVLGSIDEQMKSPNVPNMIVKKHQTLVPQIDQPTLYHLTLEPGNKIILGSDGLWDNIFFKDIKKILIDNSQSDIARDILIEKVDDVLYQNPTQRTPWSESRKFQKMNTQDGPKIDDTTFLVIQTS